VAEAVAAHREALRLKPDFPAAHNNLGAALRAQGRLAEAAAAYREAVRLKHDYPEAHCNLAAALRDQGRFREALASLRQGHELGSRRPGWPADRSAALIRQVRRLLELDGDLPAFLAGQRAPSGPGEQLELAWLCRHPAKRLYAASARFFADAFAAQAGWPDDLRAGHRYHAACSAALAGCGRGDDRPGPDDEERARLRRQALAWLRADLAAWAALAQKGRPQPRQEVKRVLTRWRQDPALGGLRDKGVLVKRPEAERQACRELWAEVDAALRRADEAQ
jgi:tetratricopeptide (TPR) repeat protein